MRKPTPPASMGAFRSWSFRRGATLQRTGKTPSSQGRTSTIIATIQKKNGLPESLPSPSCVDYSYTNLYSYNQIHVLTFTLNASDYTCYDSGLSGDYNSASSGICRKMARLGLPNVSDETMYNNYDTFDDSSIVSIPGILLLPWCWYDDVPHDLSILKRLVQNAKPAKSCPGITHTERVHISPTRRAQCTRKCPSSSRSFLRIT